MEKTKEANIKEFPMEAIAPTAGSILGMLRIRWNIQKGHWKFDEEITYETCNNHRV